MRVIYTTTLKPEVIKALEEFKVSSNKKIRGVNVIIEYLVENFLPIIYIEEIQKNNKNNIIKKREEPALITSNNLKELKSNLKHDDFDLF